LILFPRPRRALPGNSTRGYVGVKDKKLALSYFSNLLRAFSPCSFSIPTLEIIFFYFSAKEFRRKDVKP
ncbi:MAG: hypothetical protein WD597_06475, partial [Balneolaceae bacterium]